MKKTLISTICLLIAFPVMASQSSNVTYFSPHSLYVYTMGSWFFDLPYVDYCGNGNIDDFNPLVGVGYTIVNFNRAFLMNLEFDYVRNQTPSCDYAGMNRLEYYSFMLNLEYLFGRRLPLSLYVGTGGALLYDRAPYAYSDDTFCFVSSLGLKVSLSRKLKFRFDIRHYFDSDNGLDYLYLDEWGDIIIGIDSDYNYSYGSALSAGLEFHF